MSTTVDLGATDLVRPLSTLLARGAGVASLLDCLTEVVRPHGIDVALQPTAPPAGATACFRLDDGAPGTLTFTGRARESFDRSELDVLALLAELVSVAAAREREQRSTAAATARVSDLETALVTNRTIATAIGIVMARTGRTQQQAQAWLVSASQQQNRKMRDLAEGIVLTGSLEL